MIRYFHLQLIIALLLCSHSAVAQIKTIEVSTPLAPPAWGLLQRELLEANTTACKEYYQKYFDERGYLLCVPRWGGDDGPDDAIECVANWPLLHALGADEVMLTMYKQAWEGHLRQYTAAKTTHVPFAKDGMYYKEFPVMFDWLHNGEGLRVFNLQGLSDPEDILLHKRTRRYAGFYMNEDPQAPNYDPKHKIIRSLFNGSRGPLMRKATALDWAGDPIEVKGRFTLRHGERNYEDMLAHFRDYTDIIGDHPQNLNATTLALNAFLLTGEDKYRNWLLEYANAWVKRAEQNGKILPTNIGLDGTIGGATDGKWYGGTYGWAFSVVVPQTGKIAHRNRVNGGITGFGNALLLTGDPRYIRVWTDMLDKVNAAAKRINGQTMYPRMYNEKGWYAWEPTPWLAGAQQCWFWSCTAEDAKRLEGDGWLNYLQGKNLNYPIVALQNGFRRVRQQVAGMRQDKTTPDTRLADDPMHFNPASVEALNNLMQGGIAPGRDGGPLHCRLRYFDPVKRRAGLPSKVAALVHRFDANSIEVTLVNLSQSEQREVIVQSGAYGEHQCKTVSVDDVKTEVDSPVFQLKLKPGCGARLTISQHRYKETPSLKFPWNRN